MTPAAFYSRRSSLYATIYSRAHLENINGDDIQMIAHLARLGLEQILFLNEVDAVAHQVAQTGIEHRVSVLVVPNANGIVASYANIRINKYVLL